MSYITKNFTLIGYQLRLIDKKCFCASLSTDANPLYIPREECLLQEFMFEIKELPIPFIIQTKKSLKKLYNISNNDILSNEKKVSIFSLSLLNENLKIAEFEYINNNNNLIKCNYKDYIYKDSQIPFFNIGYDVVDASQAGGFDSAIHTYQSYFDNYTSLNSYGLFDKISEAVTIMKIANSNSGPHLFTIWSIGLPKKIILNDLVYPDELDDVE